MVSVETRASVSHVANERRVACASFAHRLHVALEPAGTTDGEQDAADAFGLAGSYAEAATTLAGLVEETPNDPLLLNNYGVALFWSGRKEDAIVQYQKALRIAPGLQDARKNLAFALGKQPVATGPSQPNATGGAEDSR